MDNTQCGGKEPEISQCRFDSWGENDCDPSETAGVVCDPPEAKKHLHKNGSAGDGPAVAAKKIQKHRIKVI